MFQNHTRKKSESQSPSTRYNGVQEWYDGESLKIYPGFTEFRPFLPNMNTKIEKKDFSNNSIGKRHHIHFDYRQEISSNQLAEKTGERPVMHGAESRIYVQGQVVVSVERSPRGLITHISIRSARRLKKLMSRAFNLDLWIDLTFSDDVFFLR